MSDEFIDQHMGFMLIYFVSTAEPIESVRVIAYSIFVAFSAV
jgi:hypothetical protein